MTEHKHIGGKALMDLEPQPKKILTFGEAPSSQPHPSQPEHSQPHPSRLPQPPLAGYGSRLQPDQPPSSRPEHSRPEHSRPHLSLLSSLPEVRGHFELPHQITDHLLPHLDPFEQAIYLQLYRLSWGHKSSRCLISNERLAERAHMSVAKVKTVTASLAGKGLIKKASRPHGQRVVQGVEYEVFAPTWQLQRSRPPGSQPDSSRLPGGPNKEELKEIDKGAVDCPDCYGTGMWYPEGFDKGVARCAHRRLK